MGAVAKKTASTELAVHDYGEDIGSGYEGQTSADYSIPFIAVLQQMSPQCDGSVEGARPGMLFNTVTGEMWDSKDGVEFVAGMTEHVFVEWVPREKGGGMVGRHSLDSEVVRVARNRSSEFGKLKTGGGNDLIETFYIYGVLCVDGEPSERVVLAFTSTKIKIYKHWNTKVGFFMVPTANGGKARPPLFSHLVKLSSVKEKNNKGEFFNFVLSPANGDVAKSMLAPSDPRYIAAKEVKAAVAAGLAQANYASQENAGRDSEDSSKAPF